jgi:hypothetical protein
VTDSIRENSRKSTVFEDIVAVVAVAGFWLYFVCLDYGWVDGMGEVRERRREGAGAKNEKISSSEAQKMRVKTSVARARLKKPIFL